MRSAAAVLAAPPGMATLAAIAAVAGCDGDAASLATAARDALGLPQSLLDVAVCGGPGALRALLLRCDASASPRDHVLRVAARLASRTPQLRWLAIAEDERGSERVVATWAPNRVPPRLAALSTQRARVVDSDAETLCAIAAAAGPDDLLTHARWLEILGRDTLSRRFYRELEAGVEAIADSLGGGIPRDDRRTLALFTVSRLLFLAFLEAKGWLDGDRAFLAHHHAAAARGGAVHRRLLEPLFFGTLNTRVSERAPAARAFGRVPYLNGGLFTRTPLEKRWRSARCSDDSLAALFDGIFARYRLTAREDTATWSDAAIDPEMLGRAFESLMASRERRVSGAFYTPNALVAEVTGEALARHLAGAIPEDEAWRLLQGERPSPGIASAAAARLASLRILDPACGSGAFLVHALEQVAAMRRLCGDDRDSGTVRRETLARSIFGVDANATAVWLCELRLWLSTVIETDVGHGERVPTLPNLDHNVRVGDSLAGSGFAARSPGEEVSGRSIAALRTRYARATGVRKRSLARELDRAERGAAERALRREIVRLESRRRELIALRRQRDLFGERHSPSGASGGRDAPRDAVRAAIRASRAELLALGAGGPLPFSYPSCFPDVAAQGGFDVVIANPPWVRLHNIPARSRQRLRETFAVFRLASWEPGALGAGAGRGFAAQVDLSALFVERAVDLLAVGGTLAVLLPSKLWRSLAGGGLRRFLAAHAPPLLIEDLSESDAAFDAAVYPSLLVAAKGADAPSMLCAHRRRDVVLRWSIDRPLVAFDDTPGSPWLLAPPEARRGFDRLRRGANTLATTIGVRPLLGVKCGLNEAFVLSAPGSDVESQCLRPLLRGETLAPWTTATTERIIWTHAADGTPLRSLPARALLRLSAHRRALVARSDLRGGLPWWSLFRTESARADLARVVWADVGRTLRAAFIPPGDDTVALNSCYVVRCPTVEDAFALVALLNSPLASSWLSLVAEPARGGYHRYLGWTMAMLPVPGDWPRARGILAPLGREAVAGAAPSPHELLDRAIAAFRVRRVDVAPLVEWASR